MNRSALDAIARHNMISRGGHVAVGLSGGADSVALTHFLRELAPQWDLKLEALHLNHCLRGEESDRDQKFVEEFCARWGIPLTVGSASIGQLARQRGQSVEQCARDERYRFFLRNTPPGGCVATAHTRDDNLETVLFNMVRGTGLRGLCGIPPVREWPENRRIIRPLLDCSRQEIEEYCRCHSLAYCTDSTNFSDKYSRNKIRRHVVPVFREINPGWEKRMAANLEVLKMDADYLDRTTEQRRKAVQVAANTYSAEEIFTLPEAIRRRVLLSVLKELGVSAEQRRVIQLERVLRDGGGCQLSAEWFCRVKKGKMMFYQPQHSLHWKPVEVELDGENRIIDIFDGKKLRLFSAEYKDFEKSINNDPKVLKNAVDYDRISRIVKIRGRMPGDSFKPAGRGCTKTLKKLYNEAGIPLDQRARLLVVEDDGELVWAEKFGAGEPAKVDRNTRRVLILDVLEEKECTGM